MAISGRLMGIGGVTLTEPAKGSLTIKQAKIPVPASGASKAGGTGFEENLTGLGEGSISVSGNLIRSELAAILAMFVNKTSANVTFAPDNPSGGTVYTLADAFPTEFALTSEIEKQAEFSATFQAGGPITSSS